MSGWQWPWLTARIGAQAIQVFVAFHVINPDAFGATDHNIKGMIVVGAVVVFQLDEITASIILRFFTPTGEPFLLFSSRNVVSDIFNAPKNRTSRHYWPNLRLKAAYGGENSS